jgi:hypothetical protein
VQSCASHRCGPQAFRLSLPHPDAQYHAFSTFGVLMSPDLPLERRHHEMIATMVSVTNSCRY